MKWLLKMFFESKNNGVTRKVGFYGNLDNELLCYWIPSYDSHIILRVPWYEVAVR